MFHNKPPAWAVDLATQNIEILKGIQHIMAEVQLDESVLTNAAASIEALVSAVNTFLASPAVQQLPAADVSALTQALTDAGTAQTALQNATQPPASP